MWCQHCQQDVPTLGASSDDGPRCARCHTPNQESDPKLNRFDSALERDHDTTWRNVGKAMRTAKARVEAGKASRTLRYDLEQIGLNPTLTSAPALARTQANRQASLPKSMPRGPSRVAQFGVWFFCTLGAVMLGLGIGLCSWSVAEGLFSLWTPGLMALLAGQGLLIVGLLHLLANLWAAGREAGARLARMHDELRTLRRRSDEAAGRHAASAAQFYADLAREAGPEQMIGNLRGQIDALSARLRAE